MEITQRLFFLKLLVNNTKFFKIKSSKQFEDFIFGPIFKLSLFTLLIFNNAYTCYIIKVSKILTPIFNMIRYEYKEY